MRGIILWLGGVWGLAVVSSMGTASWPEFVEEEVGDECDILENTKWQCVFILFLSTRKNS